MAIRKCHLVRNNTDGTSDVVHLLTGSDVTVRPSGQTVEDALNGLKTDIQNIELTPGPQGPAGPTGPQGPAGPGIATGGTVGQVLVKSGTADYDTSWQTYQSSALTPVAEVSRTVLASELPAPTGQYYSYKHAFNAIATFIPGKLYLIWYSYGNALGDCPNSYIYYCNTDNAVYTLRPSYTNNDRISTAAITMTIVDGVASIELGNSSQYGSITYEVKIYVIN